MRIILSCLLCVVTLQGMEDVPQDAPLAINVAEVDQGYERPILKLARLKQASVLRRQPPSDVPIPSVDSIDLKYKNDAEVLIMSIDLFDHEFPEEEIIKTLRYYSETYGTSYKSFLAKVASLRVQEAAGQLDLRTTSDEKQLTIDFLLMMREFRHTDADWHKGTAENLTVQQIALEGAREEQVVKTKYANWRAYGAAVAGFALTLITGLTTYFAHPTGTATNASTTMLAL